MIVKLFKNLIKLTLSKTNWRLKKKHINKTYTNQKPDLPLLNAIYKCNGIIHMGAHRGTEATVYDWFHKPVIWFEANPNMIFSLNDHVTQYPNQRVIHSLIGNEDDAEKDFNISNNDAASSSVFEFGKDVESKKMKMTSSIKLRTKKFDTLVQEYKIDISKFDLWVLDIQGSELIALEGAKKALEKCNFLLVEISKNEQYLDAPRWEDIKKFLYQLNFYSDEEPVGSHCDLLFIKKR